MAGLPESRQQFVVASGNLNKIKELQTVAKDFGLELFSPHQIRAIHRLHDPPFVVEDGNTYAENAMKKALAYFDWCGLPAIGDDSGLEVDALNGEPGMLSARYSGDDATDESNIEKLLSELGSKGYPNGDKITARFFCSLVLVFDDRFYHADGELPGEILFERHGENGFGYDPVVKIDELGCTLAEISFEEVCRVGFRAKAARTLFEQLS